MLNCLEITIELKSVSVARYSHFDFKNSCFHTFEAHQESLLNDQKDPESADFGSCQSIILSIQSSNFN